MDGWAEGEDWRKMERWEGLFGCAAEKAVLCSGRGAALQIHISRLVVGMKPEISKY